MELTITKTNKIYAKKKTNEKTNNNKAHGEHTHTRYINQKGKNQTKQINNAYTVLNSVGKHIPFDGYIARYIFFPFVIILGRLVIANERNRSKSQFPHKTSAKLSLWDY